MNLHSALQQRKLLQFGLLLGTLLVSKVGFAQQGSVSPPPQPQWSESHLQDARRLLQLAHTQELYNTPLSLKVENATLEEVAKRVYDSLPPQSPPIELKGVSPVKLSFSVKNSTAAGVLNAAATLAGARLWFFADRVRLAPNGALSKEELASHMQGFNSFWTPEKPGVGSEGESNKRKILCSVVAHEIEGLIANLPPETADAADRGTPQKVKIEETKLGVDTVRVQTTTVGQLSPDAQAMLQELVANTNVETSQENSRSSVVLPHISFSPGAVVELRSEGNGFLSVGTPQQGKVSWSLDGLGTSFRTITLLPEKPRGSSAVSPPFLDPSAGKS